MTIRHQRDARELVEQVRGLAPIVDQHRAALDRDRRLPQPIFDALVEADLLRLWAPRSVGGAELSPLDYLEVIEAAAQLDGSVGWILANGAGMSRVGGYVEPDVARAWLGQPRAFIASATGAVGNAMPVEGGYRVTGHWPFGSGVFDATMVMALCNVAGGSGQDPLCCVLSPSDVRIIDNWHVSGLRGTGSCDFAVDNAFVPRSHAYSFLSHRPTQAGLLYRMPQVPVFAISIGAVPLGIAGAAIDWLIGFAGQKSRNGVALRDRELIQSEVGRAETQRCAARACLREAVDRLMVATDVGGEEFVRARVRLRMACAHAAETSARVVDMMATAAGASSIFESAPLERCTRDVHAAIKHIALSANNYVVGGRVALGLDPGTTRY